jgi:hypothetical protein
MKPMTESQRLLEILGPEAMARLCREYGGEAVYVPQHPPDPNRDEKIQASFSESLKSGSSVMNSYVIAAAEFGLSSRRIQEIVNE